VTAEMSGRAPSILEVKRELFNSLRDLGSKTTGNVSLQRSLTWFREGYSSVSEYSEFLFYWLGLETMMGIAGNISPRVAISIIIFIQELASGQHTSHLNNFIQKIGLENIIKPGSSVIYILRVIFAQDTDRVNSINAQLLNFVQDNMRDLAYIFSKVFTIYYMYTRRNTVVHEGETFSIELATLSRVLENYVLGVIRLLKEY
jgi:hypothetical protein